jgi:hypothetical protein
VAQRILDANVCPPGRSRSPSAAGARKAAAGGPASDPQPDRDEALARLASLAEPPARRGRGRT